MRSLESMKKLKFTMPHSGCLECRFWGSDVVLLLWVTDCFDWRFERNLSWVSKKFKSQKYVKFSKLPSQEKMILEMRPTDYTVITHSPEPSSS